MEGWGRSRASAYVSRGPAYWSPLFQIKRRGAIEAKTKNVKEEGMLSHRTYHNTATTFYFVLHVSCGSKGVLRVMPELKVVSLTLFTCSLCIIYAVPCFYLPPVLRPSSRPLVFLYALFLSECPLYFVLPLISPVSNFCPCAFHVWRFEFSAGRFCWQILTRQPWADSDSESCRSKVSSRDWLVGWFLGWSFVPLDVWLSGRLIGQSEPVEKEVLIDNLISQLVDFLVG